MDSVTGGRKRERTDENDENDESHGTDGDDVRRTVQFDADISTLIYPDSSTRRLEASQPI